MHGNGHSLCWKQSNFHCEPQPGAPGVAPHGAIAEAGHTALGRSGDPAVWLWGVQGQRCANPRAGLCLAAFRIWGGWIQGDHQVHVGCTVWKVPLDGRWVARECVWVGRGTRGRRQLLMGMWDWGPLGPFQVSSWPHGTATAVVGGAVFLFCCGWRQGRATGTDCFPTVCRVSPCRWQKWTNK